MTIFDTLTRLMIAGARSPQAREIGRYLVRQGTAAIVREIQNRTRGLNRKSGSIRIS